MAAWRRAIELAIGGEDLAALGAIARSRTEPASRVERARVLQRISHHFHSSKYHHGGKVDDADAGPVPPPYPPPQAGEGRVGAAPASVTLTR